MIGEGPPCPPDEHCFHEAVVVPMTDPPELMTFCCECGLKMEKPQCSVHDPFKWYRPQ